MSGEGAQMVVLRLGYRLAQPTDLGLACLGVTGPGADHGWPQQGNA
jgi:hypothetical protein